MCNILHKRKTCSKKDMGYSESFSDLIVIVNVLSNKVKKLITFNLI